MFFKTALHPKKRLFEIPAGKGGDRDCEAGSDTEKQDQSSRQNVRRLETGSETTYPCPASSILSGQRQLDFPMLFEIPAAVGAVGKVGIARVVRDFQGRWEGRKTCFWFSSLSTDRLFPQPGGRRVLVFETWVVT
ncbi:MAG: hypothetical protein ACLPLR_06295 [Terriglobales bacterium]